MAACDRWSVKVQLLSPKPMKSRSRLRRARRLRRRSSSESSLAAAWLASADRLRCRCQAGRRSDGRRRWRRTDGHAGDAEVVGAAEADRAEESVAERFDAGLAGVDLALGRIEVEAAAGIEYGDAAPAERARGVEHDPARRIEAQHRRGRSGHRLGATPGVDVAERRPEQDVALAQREHARLIDLEIVAHDSGDVAPCDGDDAECRGLLAGVVAKLAGVDAAARGPASRCRPLAPCGPGWSASGYRRRVGCRRSRSGTAHRWPGNPVRKLRRGQLRRSRQRHGRRHASSPINTWFIHTA